MVENHAGAVVITEGKQILGMFSERDVMERVVAPGRDPDKTPIAEVMTKDVRTITDGTSVKEAVGIMRTHKIRHLPIVSATGEIEGIVALRYLLFDIVDDLETEASSLKSYMEADGPGG
jgi:CBS domain-containing protein